MKFTNFLRLKKPESTDYVQVEDLNENMDILDSEMKDLSDKSKNHTHTKSQITDFPTSMPPTAHNHTKSQITDFPTSMPPTAHNHTKSQITDFPTSMTPTAHNQAASTITAGTLAGQVKANATAAATVGTAQVRDIYAGTSDMTAGSSALATGALYFVYE